jgi:hypothetical protein
MYSCVVHNWNSFERPCPLCWPSGITCDYTELIINPQPSIQKGEDSEEYNRGYGDGYRDATNEARKEIHEHYKPNNE